MYIYVLKLESNKYYVGKTDNPDFRLNDHFTNSGSKWTKIYKPVQLHQLIPDCDKYDEDKYTKIYMDKYGIENVRGGSFVSIELPEETISTLNLMNKGTNDKCFRCGELGHFANKCNKPDINNNILKKEEEDKIKKENERCNCATSFMFPHRKNKCLLNNTLKINNIEEEKQITETKIKSNNQFMCNYCKKTFETVSGKNYHEMKYCKHNNKNNECKEYSQKFINECKKIDVDCTKIIKAVEVYCCNFCDKEFDTLKGATYHENFHYRKTKSKSKSKNTCYRCGRDGHYTDTCYAKKHVNGKFLY